MNPYLAGALGAVGGVVLWELIFPTKDAFVWSGDEKNVRAIEAVLSNAGIPSSVQYLMAKYVVLVRDADLAKAREIASRYNLLTY